MKRLAQWMLRFIPPKLMGGATTKCIRMDAFSITLGHAKCGALSVTREQHMHGLRVKLNFVEITGSDRETYTSYAVGL